MRKGLIKRTAVTAGLNICKQLENDMESAIIKLWFNPTHERRLMGTLRQIPSLVSISSKTERRST